jgi:PncC family amidohydrolase
MAGSDALAARTGCALLARRARLALAESCTGGLVGSRLTAIPGSSRYLLGGVVAYHNGAKAALLRVPRGMLRRHGAVSAPVAAAMARGARRVLGADLAVAVTGIAGPGGGSAGKPVGLVFVAVCGFGRTSCRRALFAGGRQQVRDQAADLALNMLLEHLEEVHDLADCGGIQRRRALLPVRGGAGVPGGASGAPQAVPHGSEL